MKKRVKSTCYLLLSMVLVIIISCTPEQKNQVPSKTEDMSQGTYDKYAGLLRDAYKTNDKYGAAVQLANLDADPKLTFKLLDEAIEENTSLCEDIYESYWLYDHHNFGKNLVLLDTTLFKQSVTLCNTLRTDISYPQYAANKLQEAKDFEANKVIEDSTNFNITLVRELEQIHKDDQEVRNRLTAKNVTPLMKEKISEEMQLIDSLNLIKIDNIFKIHGYPSRELVGKDSNFTPALVIHHSNSLATRYKYLPLLEKAVEDGVLFDGTLNMIKRRIDNMELNLK